MQLARFGDIFQTWPIVNSLRRNYPQAQIDFMCRSTFASAARPLASIDKIWPLDIATHIDQIMSSKDNKSESLDQFISEVNAEEYDQIINLSFSPLSSYLTDSLGGEQTRINGYTRHEDGYLSIPDDPSALFYGQVGVQRYNRIHITRLFSAVAEVDLIESDWQVSEDLLAIGALKFTCLPKSFVALHLGGSTEDKKLSSQQWLEIVQNTLNTEPGIRLVALGSKGEGHWLDQISEEHKGRVLDLTGQTELVDLFYIIHQSQLLLAPDSALIHIASLLNKRCLNFSFSHLNFWETGPLAEGSFVHWRPNPSDVKASELCLDMQSLLREQDLPTPNIKVLSSSSEACSYEVSGYEANEFQWQLIKAIYLGDNFPILDDIKVYTAFKQLAELTDMVLRDLEMVKQGQFQNIPLEIVNNVEQLILTLEKMIPEVRPVIWWFNTERLRIGPGPDQEVFDSNYNVFNQLRTILAVYVGTNLLSPQLEPDL